VHGNAAEEIVGCARREGATVIVVGRRPAMYGMPALLGRTVRRVLHDASCSVLVVPPPTDAARSRLAAE
jgi:nucleotide-binding universal stress UspA family protein